MAEIIPCEGESNSVRFRRWRRRYRWFFLWVSNDDKQELDDLMLDMELHNAQDINSLLKKA